MPGKTARRGRPKGSGIDDSARLLAIARLIDADPELKPTTAIKALGITDPSVIRRLRDKYSDLRAARPPAGSRLADGPAAAAPPAKPAQRHHAVAARSHSAARRTAEPAQNPPASTRSTRTAKQAARDASGKDRPSPAEEPLVAISKAEAVPALEAPTMTAAPAPVREPASRTAPVRSAPPAVLPVASAGIAASEPVTNASSSPACARPRLSLKKSEELFVALCGIGIAATNSAVAAQVSFAQNLVRSSCVSLALRQQLALNDWALQLSPWPPVKVSR